MGSIAAMTAFARKVLEGNTGYDQWERWTFYDRQTKTFIPNKEADCSSYCGAIVEQGGYPIDLGYPDHSGIWTGNFRQKCLATGQFEAIEYKNTAQVREGDFLLSDGHVAYALNTWQIAEAYSDERGAIAGGQAGNQGQETRISPVRGGWNWIIRPTVNDGNTSISKGKEVQFRQQSVERPTRLAAGKEWWLKAEKTGSLNMNAANLGGPGVHSGIVAITADGLPAAGSITVTPILVYGRDRSKVSRSWPIQYVANSKGQISGTGAFEVNVPNGYLLEFIVKASHDCNLRRWGTNHTRALV